jgi:ABC-type nitrate/sulfonate/bicarbonate transport system substrate-binding protein
MMNSSRAQIRNWLALRSKIGGPSSRHRGKVFGIGLVALALIAASCGGGESASQGGNEKSTPFILGYASTPSLGDLPVWMAMDDLKKQGYNASIKEVASFDILFAALGTDQVQLVGSDAIAAYQAFQKTGIKPIGTRSNNLWSIVSTPGFETDCKSWQGKPVGIFSKTAITYLYLVGYIDQHCPGTKPNEVIIPDSALREKAILAGRIIATMLDGTSTPRLLTDEPDKVKLVSNLSETLGFGRETLSTNKNVLASHQEVLVAFLTNYLKAIRTIYSGNADQLVELAKQYLPAAASLGDTAKVIAEYHLSNHAWCANGGLNDNFVQTTLDEGKKFNLVTGTINVDQFVMKGPLDQALKSVGQSSATPC